MSISSLPLMKEVLGINPTDEDWLQYTFISCSPYGDFIAIASEKSAVFYVKKFNNNSGEDDKEQVYFKLNKTYCPDTEIGNISALACLPVRLGGLGIRSMVQISTSAFISSHKDTYHSHQDHLSNEFIWDYYMNKAYTFSIFDRIKHYKTH